MKVSMCTFKGNNSFMLPPLPMRVKFWEKRIGFSRNDFFVLTLLHSERPKLCTILNLLSEIGLRTDPLFLKVFFSPREANSKSQKLFPFRKKNCHMLIKIPLHHFECDLIRFIPVRIVIRDWHGLYARLLKLKTDWLGSVLFRVDSWLQ